MTLSSAESAVDSTLVLRERAVRATQRLLASDGLDVSMDDIAAVAGVGRRSLFRHFDSRDALVAEALGRSLEWFGQRLAEQEPGGQDLEGWLAELARHVHRLCIDTGKGFWQMAAADDMDLPEPVAAVNSRRKANRKRWTSEVANRAWGHAGGSGDAPEVVVDAFAVFMSSFSTRSLVTDLRVSLERMTASTAASLTSIIRAQLHYLN